MTTMDYTTTIRALKRMKVETGGIICLGCGYEHGCSAHGCAILRNAVEHMEAAQAKPTLSLSVYDIGNIKPADGVEPVVHCKNCRHKYFKDFSAFCPNRVGALRPEGFCELGERGNQHE